MPVRRGEPGSCTSLVGQKRDEVVLVGREIQITKEKKLRDYT